MEFQYLQYAYEVLQLVMGTIGAVLVIGIVIFCAIFLIIYDIKCQNKEMDYLKTLSKEERTIIFDYLRERKIKVKDTFKRTKKD